MDKKSYWLWVGALVSFALVFPLFLLRPIIGEWALLLQTFFIVCTIICVWLG